MMQLNNSTILEYFSVNARINKKLLNCLFELTSNLIKVRNCNAKVYKVDDTEVIIKQENNNFDIDMVDHNIRDDDLSKNIATLKDQTLKLEQIFQQKLDHSIIEYQSTYEFMAGPFKALIVQNLTEISVQLTDQISNLIHMYKSDEVSGNSKKIRKCLSKINQNIKSIPQIDFKSLTDTIASQTLNNFSILNANLSEKLGVLIKKVAKLKKVYKKKSCNLDLVDNNVNIKYKENKNVDDFSQENVQEELMKTDESILDTDDTSENDPRNGTRKKTSNTVEGKIHKRKINMIDSENHDEVTNKKSKPEYTIIKVEPNVEREIFTKQPKSKRMTLKLAENGTSYRTTANIESDLMKLIEMQKTEKIKKEKESSEESNEMITEYNTDDSTVNISNYVSIIFGKDEEDEDNEQMFEDIINNQTIYENEQFMEIQDRLESAKETDVSSNIRKKLSHLFVLIQWEIPPAHTIEKKLTRGPDANELAQLKALNVKWGTYSKREQDTISQNWAEFCLNHDFDPADPSPFLLLQQKWNKKKLIKYTERRKFVQYLGKGLPHRALSSIYRKFRVLFRNTKSGRFAPDEDKIIRMHAESNSRIKFSELEVLLNRCRASIEVRYRFLKNIPNERVKWDLPKQELLLKTLLKEIDKQTVEELRNADITNKILANVAKKMQILVIKVIHQWKNKLYCQLFAENPIRTNIIKETLIRSLRKLGVKEYRDIDWEQIAKKFPGLSQFYLYLQLKSIITYNVPRELRENLADTLEYLHEYWVPVVRARKDYSTRCCKRLELDMNGHLVVKNDDV